MSCEQVHQHELKMWRQAVRSSTSASTSLRPSHATLRMLCARRLRDSASAGSPAAASTAEALRAEVSAEVSARMEALAAACARVGFNEQEAQQVVPGLWVGPLGPSESRIFLSSHGITHVLDATGGIRRKVSALENTWVQKPPPFEEEAALTYLQLAAEDRPDFNLEPLLRRAIDFIASALATPNGTHRPPPPSILTLTIALTPRPIFRRDPRPLLLRRVPLGGLCRGLPDGDAPPLVPMRHAPPVRSSKDPMCMASL